MSANPSETTTTPRRRAPRRRRPELIHILAIPGFARLLASEAFFDIGVVARTAAQSWVIYDITGSNLWVGAVAGIRAIPALIFPVFTGAIVDRIDRRKLLIFVRLSSSLIALSQAALIAFDILEPWHMLAISLAAGIFGAFAAPAFWAYIADLVTPRRLPRATALILIVENAGEMVAPVLTGWIIAAAGAEYIFGLISLLYLFAALVIVKAPKGRHAVGDSATEDKPSYYASVKQGFAYARKSLIIPWLFVMNASVNIFGVAVFPLMPEYATKIFDVGSVGFGVMSAAMGIGFAVGSGIIALYGMPKRLIWVIVVVSFVWDFSMIGFGFSRIFPLSLVLLFFMGIAGMIWVNAIINLFQQAATGNMRGRVMSLYAIGMGLFPLGWAYGGILSSLVGNELTLIISAIGGTPLVFLAMLFAPGLRRS